METKGKNWHSMPIEEILKELDTTEEGLTDKEAEERLKKWVEGFVILFIVFVNTIISVIQEKKAEASIEALKSMNSSSARVFRQGEDSLITSKEIVVRRYCNT